MPLCLYLKMKHAVVFGFFVCFFSIFLENREIGNINQSARKKGLLAAVWSQGEAQFLLEGAQDVQLN